MTVTLRLPSFRVLRLMFGGLLAGALLVNPAGTTGVTTYTRVASCSGLNFHPIDQQTLYGTVGGAIYREILLLPAPPGSGYFLCDPHLPHKAVVTKLRFLVYDEALAGSVRFCALYRRGLTLATASQLALVAQVSESQDSGMQRLADTSIDNATIDNANYAYYLQCQIYVDPNHLDEEGLSDTDFRIFGADVTYKITAANG